MNKDIKAVLVIILIVAMIEVYPPLGYSLLAIAAVTMIINYYGSTTKGITV